MSQLYLISPPQISLDQFLPELDVALSTGLISVFQLRLQDMPMVAIERTVEPVLEVCHAHDIPLIINNYVDLAHRYDCDGVHLGQSDMPYAEARQILGPNKMIGVTCHDSKDLAFKAADAGAEYVAFGAFYPTKTKDSGYRPTVELLRDWVELTTVPCVAIGGITPDNCKPLIDAGADFIAVVSAVWEHDKGAKAGIEAFKLYISSI